MRRRSGRGRSATARWRGSRRSSSPSAWPRRRAFRKASERRGRGPLKTIARGGARSRVRDRRHRQPAARSRAGVSARREGGRAVAETRAALAQLRDEFRASGAFDDTIVKREYVESNEAIAREAATLHGLGDLLVDWRRRSGRKGDSTGGPRSGCRSRSCSTARGHGARRRKQRRRRTHEFRRRDGFKLTDRA